MWNQKSTNTKFSINDLILFCMHSVSAQNEKCTFDRLVKECFTLFPETLQFERYPVWPDSRKLDRPLRFLKKEQLIIGEAKEYFVLTSKGQKKAEQVSKALKQGRLW